MEDKNGLTVFDRLKAASGSATDAELAVNLKLTKQAIAQARAKKVVPAAWIPKAAELFNVSTDWLFFGRGPMRPGDTQPLEKHERTPAATHDGATGCSLCAELKAELALEKAERRELSAENRILWKENGELRERCAKFEERLQHSTPDGVFLKGLDILSNDKSAGK